MSASAARPKGLDAKEESQSITDDNDYQNLYSQIDHAFTNDKNEENRKAWKEFQSKINSLMAKPNISLNDYQEMFKSFLKDQGVAIAHLNKIFTHDAVQTEKGFLTAFPLDSTQQGKLKNRKIHALYAYGKLFLNMRMQKQLKSIHQEAVPLEAALKSISVDFESYRKRESDLNTFSDVGGRKFANENSAFSLYASRVKTYIDAMKVETQKDERDLEMVTARQADFQKSLDALAGFKIESSHDFKQFQEKLATLGEQQVKLQKESLDMVNKIESNNSTSQNTKPTLNVNDTNTEITNQIEEIQEKIAGLNSLISRYNKIQEKIKQLVQQNNAISLKDIIWNGDSIQWDDFLKNILWEITNKQYSVGAGHWGPIETTLKSIYSFQYTTKGVGGEVMELGSKDNEAASFKAARAIEYIKGAGPTLAANSIIGRLNAEIVKMEDEKSSLQAAMITLQKQMLDAEAAQINRKKQLVQHAARLHEGIENLAGFVKKLEDDFPRREREFILKSKMEDFIERLQKAVNANEADEIKRQAMELIRDAQSAKSATLSGLATRLDDYLKTYDLRGKVIGSLTELQKISETITILRANLQRGIPPSSEFEKEEAALAKANKTLLDASTANFGHQAGEDLTAKTKLLSLIKAHRQNLDALKFQTQLAEIKSTLDNIAIDLDNPQKVSAINIRVYGENVDELKIQYDSLHTRIDSQLPLDGLDQPLRLQINQQFDTVFQTLNNDFRNAKAKLSEAATKIFDPTAPSTPPASATVALKSTTPTAVGTVQVDNKTDFKSNSHLPNAASGASTATSGNATGLPAPNTPQNVTGMVTAWETSIKMAIAANMKSKNPRFEGIDKEELKQLARYKENSLSWTIRNLALAVQFYGEKYLEDHSEMALSFRRQQPNAQAMVKVGKQLVQLAESSQLNIEYLDALKHFLETVVKEANKKTYSHAFLPQVQAYLEIVKEKYQTCAADVKADRDKSNAIYTGLIKGTNFDLSELESKISNQIKNNPKGERYKGIQSNLQLLATAGVTPKERLRNLSNAISLYGTKYLFELEHATVRLFSKEKEAKNLLKYGKNLQDIIEDNLDADVNPIKREHFEAIHDLLKQMVASITTGTSATFKDVVQSFVTAAEGHLKSLGDGEKTNVNLLSDIKKQLNTKVNESSPSVGRFGLLAHSALDGSPQSQRNAVSPTPPSGSVTPTPPSGSSTPTPPSRVGQASSRAAPSTPPLRPLKISPKNKIG